MVFFFRRHPRAFIGFVILFLWPSKKEEFIKNKFFGGDVRDNFWDRCIRLEINHTYYSLPEKSIEESNRKYFWGTSAGKKWHDYHEAQVVAGKHERMERRLEVAEWVIALCAAGKVKVICEIGTGNGYLMEKIHDRIKELNLPVRLMGYDLSEECIREAKSKKLDVDFRCGDAFSFFESFNASNVAFLSFGTMEYFTEGELSRFLGLVSRIEQSYVALGEPINIDRSTEIKSKPRGNLAFSHNHEFFLFKNGFRLLRKKVYKINPKVPFYEDVLILAESGSFNANSMKAM